MQVLRKALQDGAYLLNLDARDMSTIVERSLQNMVDRGLLADSQQDLLQTAIMTREEVVSTAIGHAVAVPHAYLDEVDVPLVVFVRLKHSVNLGAPDGIPTRFLFILMGPKDYATEHLDTLTTIARVMSDEQFRYDASVALNGEDLLRALEDFVLRTSIHTEVEPPTVPEGLTFSGYLGGGIVNDLKRRLPHYVSDFKSGLHSKCLASVLFLFFACLAPTVTFGGLMATLTDGQIGVVEMIIAVGMGGVIYALFSGQPLTILGGTGPMLVLTALVYQMSKDVFPERYTELFLPFYAWIGLWAALFVILMAIFETTNLLRYFSRFTDEIFAALISLIYISEALKSLYRYLLSAWREDGVVDHDQAFLSLILGLGTFIVAMALSRFHKSRYLRPKMREFLADFGPSIAVLSMVLFAFSFTDIGSSNPTIALDTLDVPETFGPTIESRSWLVNLGALPTWAIFGAAIPGMLVAVLVYLDQNITVRLVNSRDHKLKKGEGYHLDFLVCGFLLAICSLFGLPWLVAATVRSLNHVRALATTEDVLMPGGETKNKIIHVRENRVTNFSIHLLIAGSLLLVPWLKMIPLPVLYGLFLFMGVVSIYGNQFFERLSLWLMDPSLYPATHYIRQVPIKRIHLFTLIQFVMLTLLWIVKESHWGILFPLFIAFLVPIRLLLPKIMPVQDVLALDMEEDPEVEHSQWV